MRKIVKIGLLLLVFISLINESIAQKLKTKWVQEFETNMSIIDVPLVEDDYVYVHLRKGEREFIGGKNYLQKRKISDNSLVTEIEINFTSKDGKQMSFLQNNRLGFRVINSELVVIAHYNSKKEKKGSVFAYKLNKEEMIFENPKTIIEIPLEGFEIGVDSYVLQKENDNFIVLTLIKGIRNNSSLPQEQYFVLSKNNVKEIDFKEYTSYEIYNKMQKIVEPEIHCNQLYEFTEEELMPKIICNNNEFVEYLTIYNNEVNFYGLAREKECKYKKDVCNIYLINYNSNQNEKYKEANYKLKNVFYKDYKQIISERTLNNCSINESFYLKADKDDRLSSFKLGANVFYVKIDKWTRQGASSKGDIGNEYALIENLGVCKLYVLMRVENLSGIKQLLAHRI